MSFDNHLLPGIFLDFKLHQLLPTKRPLRPQSELQGCILPEYFYEIVKSNIVGTHEHRGCLLLLGPNKSENRFIGSLERLRSTWDLNTIV